MRESTTISTAISKKSIRCRQHCLQQYISVLSVVIICIFISSSLSCNAFQMTTTSKGRASSYMQMSINSRGSILKSIPAPSRLANQNSRIHSSFTTTSRCISTYTSLTGSCNQRNLFPQRSSSLSPSRSILQMSDNNQVSDNNEETNCPVTKLWLSFRKLLAKFWVSSSSIVLSFLCLFAC